MHHDRKYVFVAFLAPQQQLFGVGARHRLADLVGFLAGEDRRVVEALERY
jgi:hypothetical protein